ncbi:MAG: ATP-binding protein [Vulcanimicrobiota bacterium]
MIYKDNGMGFYKNESEKIFLPGYRSSREKGTGFGLSSCKKIIEAHGGTINARREGLGWGITFVLEFPSDIVQSIKQN